MVVRGVDPRPINETVKEAVVDALLNNVGARVSGFGEFHRVIYGIRPSSLLVSGFLVPCPEEKRELDEESNPLQINAHGLDLHVASAARAHVMRARLTAAVYVRVFPTAEEIRQKPPVFLLKPEVRKELTKRVSEGRDALRAELGLERRKEQAHPEWKRREAELRRDIQLSLGLALDGVMPEAVGQAEAAEATEGTPVCNVEAGPAGPTQPDIPSDAAYSPADPPQKWLRIELDLPTLEFTPVTCEADAARANAEMKTSIQAQLRAWFESDDASSGGKRWGYRRRAKIVRSDLANWQSYVHKACASDSRPVFPQFDMRWVLSTTPDPLDPARLLVHVAVENWTEVPTGVLEKEVECAVFQISVTLDLAHDDLKALMLDRVKPSYRYNQYLHYPALGFNGGVRQAVDGERVLLRTTWTPRYVLPRIVQTDAGAELRFQALATQAGIARLEPLVKRYAAWLKAARETRVEIGLEAGPKYTEHLAQERTKLETDVGCWEDELLGLQRGLSLLLESSRHWSGPGPQTNPKGIPCEAWFAMNEAMSRVGGEKYQEWRLFQLAFILSMVPIFATRIPGFEDKFTEDVARRANGVTLLYFATGGGKSEAFLGLLLFVLLIDRLRGKERGISALMRYPLRLLTLQQARRTMRVLAAGELQRIKRKIPGEPLSLGFWVGSTNTPNWHSNEGVSEVPSLDGCPLSKEAEVSEQAPYSQLRKQWLKLETCPFCGAAVALRRAPKREGGTLGHYCTADRSSCGWVGAHTGAVPLPFYIVDEDIYALAPTVLLGTVDKLAVIGQSYRTIRNVFGMFGLAPFRDPRTGRLQTPLQKDQWERALADGLKPLFPAFGDGVKRFFDPFPSLLIQDEAHLLEESLGTFAGLFESALDAGLDRLATPLKDQICMEPNNERRRRIKVIAASATVSEPQRQMRNLYQRETTNQFPHPGPDLYRSFYAEPKLPANTPANAARLALADIEQRAHGARVYAAIVTNGHRHTVAMATILGQFHLLITELYEDLRSSQPERQTRARGTLSRWLSESGLADTHRAALAAASIEELLTLVDLHRIALTYVTNKKGGDQVIDTERAEFEALHQAAGFDGQTLQTRLISGAVSASEIQAVVREAEKRVRPGEPFPDLSSTLRSIIATSAISHGVDVEEFNAMFFAGLPSDIAEYIQASSRVGRTHAGFSLLVPVPQRQRDRFVVEIFDIFHRFLERMVLPAAVDRWAEKAIRRVIPSVMQEYLCGVSRIAEIVAAAPGGKGDVRNFRRTEQVRDYLQDPRHRDALIQFVIDALGLAVRPPLDGEPYYRALVQKEISGYRTDMEVAELRFTDFKNFFEQKDKTLRPMTSLRDVDQAGIIHESRQDARGRKVGEGVTAQAMKFIRHGVVGELDDEDDVDDAADRR